MFAGSLMSQQSQREPRGAGSGLDPRGAVRGREMLRPGMRADDAGAIYQLP